MADIKYIIIIGLTQYYITMLNLGKMLIVNRKNCYVTQKIDVWLKQ